MLSVEAIPVLNDNYAWLLRDEDAGVVAVVDPGEAAPVEAWLKKRSLTLTHILITHHHGDHIGGLSALKAQYGAHVIGPAADVGRIAGIDEPVSDGAVITLGNGLCAKVIATPGHTSGHISFWFERGQALFSADTLFSLGCGRLFEGTPAQMWNSLLKLRALPDETRIFCGHEYSQSNARFALSVDPDNAGLIDRAAEIGRLRDAGAITLPALLGAEKRQNPFLRADDPTLAAAVGLAGKPAEAVFAHLRSAKDNF
jgi:hydroxyacylglutathione hydrolase